MLQPVLALNYHKTHMHSKQGCRQHIMGGAGCSACALADYIPDDIAPICSRFCEGGFELSVCDHVTLTVAYHSLQKKEAAKKKGTEE